MRIEKINEHQIRCTLYQKDLKDREIRISELAYGTEKARALFRDMMQQASYEFGFEADDIPLMIEAIPMLPDALILLITKVEDPDELDTRFSNFTDDPSEHYLDDSSTDDFVIINDDEEFDADDFDIDGPDSAEDLNIEQMLNEVNSQTKWSGRGKADAVLDQLFHGNVQKESKDNKTTADKNKPDINLEHPMEPDVDVNEALVDITRIFSFSSLEKLVEMCGHLRNFYNGPNTAYRSTSSGKYYIILHRGIYDLARFARAEAVAAEYGTPCPNNHAAPQFLAEHCEVLIADHAVQVLGTL